MTKAEIIRELHMNGEWWANPSYPKKYLEDRLNRIKKAKELSIEELFELVHRHKKEER